MSDSNAGLGGKGRRVGLVKGRRLDKEPAEQAERETDGLDKLVEMHSSLVAEIRSRDARLQDVERVNAELRDNIDELQASLTEHQHQLLFARETSPTLNTIEMLENRVLELTQEMHSQQEQKAKLQASLDSNQTMVEQLSGFDGWIEQLAEKLGIKSQGRTRPALMSAVNDEVRKLVG